MTAHRTRGSIGRALTVGVVLALAPSTAQAQDDEPPDTGWDIRSLDLGASLDDPDAPDPIENGYVLQAAGAQGQPERSPDGTRLAFVSADASSPDWPSVQVHVLEPDGTQIRVTDHDAGADQPTWSPDGKRIAFVGRAGGIFSKTPGEDDQRTLVTFEDANAPDWSPDGRFLAFQRGGERGDEIWTVNVRTGKLRQLTHSEPNPERCKGPGKPVGKLRDPYAIWARMPVCEYRSRDPAWSPDGDWIAFMRHEDMFGGNLEFEDTDLWLMRPDGSEKHRAVAGEDKPYERPGFESPDGHFQGPPAWSPDGRFVALMGGHCQCLLLVDVATGAPRQIKHRLFEGIDGPIDWGADGRMVFSWADPTSSVGVVE